MTRPGLVAEVAREFCVTCGRKLRDFPCCRKAIRYRERLSNEGQAYAALRELGSVMQRALDDLEAHAGGPRDQTEEEAALLADLRAAIAKAKVQP